MSTYHLIRDGEIVASRDFPEGEEVPKLAANKGVWAPEIVVDPDFDPSTQVREGPVQQIRGSSVLLVYTVRAKSADEVGDLRAGVIAAIRAEAKRRILDIMDEDRQRNSLARGVELITTLGPDPAKWPAEDQQTYAVVSAEWGQIKAIRARSDVLEAALPRDAKALSAFDPLAGWDE